MRLIQAKQVRQHLLRTAASVVHGLNLARRGFGDFGPAVLLSLSRQAFSRRMMPENSGAMKMVLALANPFKVVRDVIRLHAVFVIRLMLSLWAWAYERFENKTVDTDLLAVASKVGEDNPKIASVAQLRLEDPSCLDPRPVHNGPDPAKIRNFVQRFVANYWKPTLFGHYSLRQTARMKAAATRYGSERSGATLAATRSLA